MPCLSLFVVNTKDDKSFPSPRNCAAIVIVSVLAIGVLAVTIGSEPMGWERTITSKVGELPDFVSDGFSLIMIFGTLPAALAISVLAVWFSTRRAALLSVAAMLTGYWVMLMMKGAVGRARPTAADLCCGLQGASSDGFSFPSGHSTLVGLAAVTIWALWGRKAGIAATVVAVMVAIGRVVLGEHWTMDVIVGLGLGATTGLAVFGIVGPALENAAPRTTVDSKA